MERPIVLASQSRYRRALLDQLGLPYIAATPDYNEDHTLPMTPDDLALYLARGKAESLSKAHPNGWILGSDQLAVLDGEILQKPGTEERAVEQLLRLAGHTHQLLTAVALHDAKSGETYDELVTFHMRMRPISRSLAEAYIRRDKPLDCVGAYKVESTGMALFEEMSGPDYTAIIGLPLTTVSRLLSAAGVDMLALALHGD